MTVKNSMKLPMIESPKTFIQYQALPSKIRRRKQEGTDTCPRRENRVASSPFTYGSTRNILLSNRKICIGEVCRKSLERSRVNRSPRPFGSSADRHEQARMTYSGYFADRRRAPFPVSVYHRITKLGQFAATTSEITSAAGTPSIPPEVRSKQLPNKTSDVRDA